MPITINVKRIKPLPIYGMPDMTTDQPPYDHVLVPDATPDNIEAIIVKLNEVIEVFNTMFETGVTNG